jgi:Ca-activated chloride channel homolog
MRQNYKSNRQSAIDNNKMRFEHPQILWLLLVVPPAFGLFFWWRERARQQRLTRFIEARLLSALTVGISPARKKIRFACLMIAVEFLVLALARPQHGFDLQEVTQRGLDIVVAVDTSKSMLATDIAPDRLTRARLAALELMQKARTDRMGLVAFAGSAFLECPLTIDNTAFQQCVQALDVNTISQGGTAIAEAIHTALGAFKEDNHHRVLVMFTDGEDNDTGALEAAQAAAKAGLKIFTIGIGTAAGELLDPNLVRDEQGNAVKSHLNEELLQQIATLTGGFYLPLRGAGTMDTLYERGLAPLPKTEGKERLVRRYHEQFHWPLAAALLLLLAELFVPERKREVNHPGVRSPGLSRSGPSRGRRDGTPNNNTAATAAVMALLFFPPATRASPAAALQDYRSGNFTNALEEFSRLAQVRTNDLRLPFNAGDAAYRATNFDLARKLFQQVTLSADLRLQQKAFYNLGNTQFQLAKGAKDLDGLQAGLEAAEKTFARATALDPDDADAAFNLAFVKSAIEQVKQFREAIRRAKSEADTAVQRAEFHRALQIMEPLQKTIAAKLFEDYTKKLKDIDDIATPHQP